jgi:glycosyltransferase involved in cell wall biosynthesis
MASIFRRSHVSISLSEHDGTPNTLLEAMACGCFPVAGDLESIREWIEDGVNGLLVQPGSAVSSAKAVLRTIAEPDLLEHGQVINVEIVAERASYDRVMLKVEEFYSTLTR